MSDDPRIIALTAEAEGLRRQLEQVRRENDTLRRHQVEARHHLALALRSMQGDAPVQTDRFHNGG